MRRVLLFALPLALVLLAVQCQSSGKPAVTPSSVPTAVVGGSTTIPGPSATTQPSGKTAADLAALGDQVYKQSCGRCHDDPFAGPLSNGLRSYTNAKDLLRFMQTKMPQDRPGSLPAEQYLQVLAGMLLEGGVVKPDAILDASNLAAITLP